MRRQLIAALVVVFGSLAFVGCGAKTAPVDDKTDSNTTSAAAGDSADAEIAEAFAKLSPEDRAAAEKQKICPVGGGPLGTMGPPAKVAIEGRDVFLCCAHCESLLREDPKKYLAKLDEK